MTDHVRILSRDDVGKALSMEQAITLMRQAFIGLSRGDVLAPQRMRLDLPDQPGELLVMPCAMKGNKHASVKLVSIHPENKTRGLPLIHAFVFLADAETGQLQALMDGEHLTALRTGAASGLATDLLAPLDARMAVIFGSGVQARTQLEAVCAVRAIERAYVFGRDSQRLSSYCRDMSDLLRIPVLAATNHQILKDADIICTATNSTEPLFADSHLKKGVHINAVGAYRRDMCEVPGETVARALVVMDQRSACMEEAGDLTKPLDEGLVDSSDWVELGQVATGNHTQADQVTLFKSVGNAVQDLVAATQILANARTLALGVEAAL